MMGCQNLAVPAEVMQHVVNVESSRNPYAIGVVGGQLVRQPQNLGEAVATVRMLEQKGYNYSLGVAQINRNNLGKYGIDSYEKAFDVCPNLSAGSQILAQCYASANRDWGKAFSCYYSGNFTTGYRDGYVQKIYESIAKSSLAGAQAIPLQGAKIPVKVVSVGNGVTTVKPDSPGYRVAMRSVLDAAASALISPAAAADAPPSRTQPVQQVQLAQAPMSQAQQIQALQQQLLLAQQAQAQQAQAQQAQEQMQAQQQLQAAQRMLANPRAVSGQPMVLPQGTGMPGARAITNPALVATPQAAPGRIATDAATAAAMAQVGMQLPQNLPAPQAGRIATDPATAAVMSQIGVSAASPLGNAPAGGSGVFEPQVHGPNDPAPGTQQAPAEPGVDHADLRQAPRDDAFVF
jgi:type IV secretion system protein VirB1